jgi:hypothetical protein
VIETYNAAQIKLDSIEAELRVNENRLAGREGQLQAGGGDPLREARHSLHIG